MGRILAIDYGQRRCGLAVTDELRIVGSPLQTVDTRQLKAFLTKYLAENAVDIIVVGKPTTLRGEASESEQYIAPFMQWLEQSKPEGVQLVRYDERFTSTMAHQAMLHGGLRRMARRDKATVDRTAATIILNDYLTSIYSQ